MKKSLFAILILVAMLLSACQAPAATQAPAAAEPAAAEPTAAPETAAEATVEEPTAAPAEAEAPAEEASGEPLKIAVLAPTSGQVATFGISTVNGAQQAVDEWNAKGGVLGRQIEMVVKDSQCNPDAAVNAANQVIDENIKYIVGEVCSSATIPITDIAESNKVLQITPASTNTQVTLNPDGSTRTYVFRACFIDPFQGLVMAKFAKEQGFTTAFVVYDQGNDYTRGLAEAFEEAFTTGGGTVLGKETYTKTDTDFSAILTKVAESKAEVLYVPDYYNIINLIGAQAKEKGVTAVMMGGDGWDSADLDVAAADGGYYSNHYDAADTRQIVQDFIKEYQNRYEGKTPDALATLGYDAMNILIASIEKAGVDDTTAVAEAMSGITFEAVSGTVTYDEFHNPVKSAAVIHVKDGQKIFQASVAP